MGVEKAHLLGLTSYQNTSAIIAWRNLLERGVVNRISQIEAVCQPKVLPHRTAELLGVNTNRSGIMEG